MHIDIRSVDHLRFDDGDPVRAASAIQPLGDGWLVAQDDAVHAAWLVGDEVRRLRLLPPIEGHDSFSEAEGTKHLKPDLEAASALGPGVGGPPSVVLLGSGSSPVRTRAVLVRLEDATAEPQVHVADLAALYPRVAAALGIAEDGLNLEGACVLGERLRWFHRGSSAARVASASVDLDLRALVDVLLQGGGTGAGRIPVDAPRHYELDEVDGVGLAITDAVALPDGRVLVSAAAEDTPNAIDDGDVVASALVLLDREQIVDVAELQLGPDGTPWKVEGLALVHRDDDLADGAVDVLGVVDADDATAASVRLGLRVAMM